MSSDFDKDDFARILALEHAFAALALISANNYAYLAETKATLAVRKFQSAIEGSMFDDASIPKDVRDLAFKHLRRLFEHVSHMAKTAEDGYDASKSGQS